MQVLICVNENRAAGNCLLCGLRFWGVCFFVCCREVAGGGWQILCFCVPLQKQKRNEMPQTGTIYLIPNTLGDCDLNTILPPYNAEVTNSIRNFIAEDVRTVRRFLRK